MIVFDLRCPEGHRFEGWFASSEDFSAQQARGLVACPRCGAVEVVKAPMAPAVPRKGNRQVTPAGQEPSIAMAGGSPPPEVAQALQKLAKMQAEALQSSKWVGEQFTEQSRAMHYGEREAETIHGKATPKQAKELFEEGVPVAPLPFPVTPPEELN
jgi:hypothetical protein